MHSCNFFRLFNCMFHLELFKQAFTLCEIMKTFHAQNIDNHILFVNFKQAFDSSSNMIKTYMKNGMKTQNRKIVPSNKTYQHTVLSM